MRHDSAPGIGVIVRLLEDAVAEERSAVPPRNERRPPVVDSKSVAVVCEKPPG